MPYAKVYREIATSSINEEELHVRWMLLILAVSCNIHGVIYGTEAGLGRLANLTRDQAEDALTKLRRGGWIVRLQPRLWQVVNYDQYLNPPRKTVRWISPRDRMVFTEDGFTCVYCGGVDHLSVDHVIPRSRGGSDDFANLVTACMPCNLRKGPKTPEQAGMVMRFGRAGAA